MFDQLTHSGKSSTIHRNRVHLISTLSENWTNKESRECASLNVCSTPTHLIIQRLSEIH